MGITFADTPLARIIRWAKAQADGPEPANRPPGTMDCYSCSEPVAPGEGVWFNFHRVVSCDDEDCITEVQALSY